MADAHRLDEELQSKNELEQTYQRLGELERNRAVAKERERIMSDMHDGTAGLLSPALSLIRSSQHDPTEVASMLQEALDDLRMTIEALDPGENSLPAVLGIMRAPIDRRLRQQGLELDWKIGEVDDSPVLNSTDARNIMRLIQEGVANVIRHANASRVEIHAGRSQQGDRIEIRIRDDGCGGVNPREGGA